MVHGPDHATELADTYRVFKIDPDDLGIAKPAREGQRYYSFNDRCRTLRKSSACTVRSSRNRRSASPTSSSWPT